MPFVFVEVDPFNPAVTGRAVQETNAYIPVRRPLMGLLGKEDTFATLQVLTPGDGTYGLSHQWVSLLNSSTPTGYGDGTSNFFVTQIRHPRSERVQLSTTFGKSFLYTFGEAPIVIEVQGALLKAANFPWVTEWLRNYEATLRASRTIEAAARVYFTVDGTIYEGHMLSSTVIDVDSAPFQAAMAFTMFLTNVIYKEIDYRTEPGVNYDTVSGSTTGETGIPVDLLTSHPSEWLQGLEMQSSGVLDTSKGKLSSVSLGGDGQGEFYFDGKGLVLQSVGGITQRSTPSGTFNRLALEQLAAEAIRVNEFLGGNIDIGQLRQAIQQLELLDQGYGFASGTDLAEDAGRLSRLLDGGVGGYANQMSEANEDIQEVFNSLI